MRWVWRVLLACLAGVILSAIGYRAVLKAVTSRPIPPVPAVLVAMLMAIAPFMLAGAAYAVLSRRWGPRGADGARREPTARHLLRWCGLGLPVLLLVLWVWSYCERLDLVAVDSFHYPREARGGEVLVIPRFDRGTFTVRYCRLVPGEPDRFAFLSRWGFRYTLSTDHRYKAGPFIESNTYVPIWFLMLLSLPPGAVCLRWHLRDRRISNRIACGQCVRCGYSLTGNVSGVCPECGERI